MAGIKGRAKCIPKDRDAIFLPFQSAWIKDESGRAIVDFANNNEADHIIVGSRGTSALRRYLGSVSSQVVAEAECTIH